MALSRGHTTIRAFEQIGFTPNPPLTRIFPSLSEFSNDDSSSVTLESIIQLARDQFDNLSMDILQNQLKRAQLDKPGKFSIAAAILTTSLTYYVAKNIIYRLYFHPLAKLPGPSVSWIPFLGNFPEQIREETPHFTKRLAKQYGPIFVTHGLFNRPELHVADPVLFKEVLTTHQYDFPKAPEGARFLSQVLGDSLLVAEGDEHKRQRKLLNPAFSIQSTKNLTPFVYGPMLELFKHWDAILRGSKTPVSVEVSRWMSHVTLDVIGLAAFGENFNTVKHDGDSEKVNKLSEAFRIIFDPTTPTLLIILRFVLPFTKYIPIKRNRDFLQGVRWLRQESEALVHRGIARARSGSSTSKANSRSLLSIMVDLTDDQTGNAMTPEEIREQCMTFLTAGHETTALSLSWCLWLLAQNQSIQDQLRAEVTPVFINVDLADPSTYPDLDIVDKLHVLNNVCKENSRLIPVVPITYRQSIEDLNLAGYFIPKNTYTVIPLVAIHHDKRIWGDDAEVFRPSRWDEVPASKVTPYEYLPFLAGGRKCIGYRFALAELKIILGLLLTKYQFFEKPGFEVKQTMEITLRPSPNMTLLVKSVASQ
ncbi:cytochrome P450 [Dichotomocladium elegans]|nr:cytochrome P450 [Dichotomocladium elegans]